MKIRMCRQQNDIKPTFSFYCRWCYHYLQQKSGLDVKDYITYFKMTYNRKVLVEDCSYKRLHEIHNHFQYKLRVTDKPLAELLEILLVLKVDTLNWT